MILIILYVIDIVKIELCDPCCDFSFIVYKGTVLYSAWAFHIFIIDRLFLVKDKILLFV